MNARMSLLAGLLAAGLAVSAGGAEEGFQPLFNGKDLTGWHIEKGAPFSVKDGVICLEGGKGWLRSDKQYQDFELRLEFRFVKGAGDSGIFVRYSGKDRYQVQTNSAFGPRGLGSLRTASTTEDIKASYDEAVIAKVRRPAGQWYSYVITVQGRRGEVKVNDVPLSTAENLAVRPGYIGIQAEGAPLEFRNIRIREILPSSK